MSYIIKNGFLIAKTPREMKSGEGVWFSWTVAKDAVDANREISLVNAHCGVISNAKKWEKVYHSSPIFTAIEINPREFLL